MLITEYSPASTSGWDYFGGLPSPACYSDLGPDIVPWSTIDYSQSASDTTMTPVPLAHRRSHTFPTVTHDDYDWGQICQDNEIPTSAGAYSDIPSIEVTSPDCFHSQSPGRGTEQNLSPPGMSGSHSSPILHQNEEERHEPSAEHPNTPPLFAVNTRLHDDQIDYYGDYLSPVDKPPINSRRSSTASSMADGSQAEVASHSGTRLQRSQTLPSSLGQQNSADQERLHTTVSSPRTRNYLQVYFQRIHKDYPILNPASLTMRSPSNTMSTYQLLLAAAIGALIHHQSRSLSSPYVRLAMSLNSEIDFWSSISGVHCALMLAIYCFHEESLSFSDEMDHEDQQRLHIAQSMHPHVNLWLHCCQICATCIDLGMSLGFLSGPDPINVLSKQSTELDFFPETDLEKEMEAMFKNTFRIAYILDKRISNLKQRPRAIHGRDLHIDLLNEYMLET